MKKDVLNQVNEYGHMGVVLVYSSASGYSVNSSGHKGLFTID